MTACIEVDIPNELMPTPTPTESPSPSPTETPSPTKTPTPTPTHDGIPDELPVDMPITLNLYTGFGGGANAYATQDIIDSFNEMYPMVNIILNNEGNYANLRDIVTVFIDRGTVPALIMGYPDHYAEYIAVDALVPFDSYMNHPIHGLDDLDDFISAFLAENQQFEYTYSLPIMKSTQLVAYNKTLFDAHGITFDYDEVVTWDRLHNEIAPIVVGNGANQCENLLLIGSSANAFINFVHQWGIGYTNQEGRIHFVEDREATTAMFADLIEMFEARTIVSTRAEWNDQYGSTRFRNGDACMIDASSAGIRFNIPSGANAFEVGFIPAIQKHATPEDGPMSVVQQGPNIAIGADTNDYERLAAWLFIRHATNAENSAHIAVAAQYLPVRYSSYETDIWLDFINSTDPDEQYFIMGTRTAMAQEAWYNYDDAFIAQPGDENRGNHSSTRVRHISGLAFEDLWLTRDPDDTLDWIISELD